MKKTLLTALIAGTIAFAYAQVPSTLSYQGILVKTSPPADAGKPVDDGTHFVRFRFYTTPSGGTPVYSSVGTGSGNQVTTFKGMFSFIIGSGTPGNDPIPANIFGSQLYVEIEADGVTFPTRIPLTTTPYAFVAQSANTMNAANLTGTLDPARIAAGAIDNSKLASGIDASKLTTGTLPAARIGNDAIDNAKMADNAINTAELVNNAVTSAKIADGTIVAADLADGAVTLAKHADNSVNSAKIVDGSIATVDIADGAITAAKLASGATLSGSGAANRVAFWSGTSALSSSSTLTWNGTNFGIGPATAGNFLHVAADVGGATTVATFEGHSATASRGPGINFIRSKGSVATPSAVTDGDYLGGVGALGRTASAYNISSGIQFEVDGTVSGTSVPGRITFSTTNVGSSSASEKMRLTSTGRLGIGTNAPASFLDVATDGNQWNLSSTEGDFKIGTTTHRIKMGVATSGGGAGDAYIGSQGGTNRLFLGAGTTLAQFQTMTLTGGSVGIGTSAPGALLDVNGTVVFRGFTGINRTTGITGSDVFSVQGTAGANAYVGMYLNGTDAASWPFYGYATGGLSRMWHYYNGSTGSWVLWNGGDRIVVTSSGNVGIGTSSPARLLHVNGNMQAARYYFPSGVSIFNIGSTYTILDDHWIPNLNNTFDLGTSVYRWRILYTNNSPNVSSDERLKNDIKNIKYGLNEIINLRPVSYSLKSDQNKQVHLGLIAQEVRQLIPEIVTEDLSEEKILGMAYEELIPVLIKAIQEQHEIIKSQGEAINSLRGELAEIKGAINSPRQSIKSGLGTAGNE